MAGLIPTKEPEIRRCYLPTTDSNTYYMYQPVAMVGDANDNEVRTKNGVHAPGTLSEIGQVSGADGTVISGVIVGIETDDDTAPRYRKSGTEAVVLVDVSKDQVYEVECTAALTNNDVYLNAVLVNGTAGSTTTGKSTCKLDKTSDVPASDASNPLLIVGLSPRENDTRGAHALVKILQHTENEASAGIA